MEKTMEKVIEFYTDSKCFDPNHIIPVYGSFYYGMNNAGLRIYPDKDAVFIVPNNRTVYTAPDVKEVPRGVYKMTCTGRNDWCPSFRQLTAKEKQESYSIILHAIGIQDILGDDAK